MFYNQPLSLRFGTELLKHIDHVTGIEPYWDTLDIAVAWVRASGASYLEESLRSFLHHGGRLSFIVGIDLHNTTREGLQVLLDFEGHGACETFVYHNEAGSIFHPKIYLFRNEEEARLIVGSNNLTAAGLYSNVEAGLQVDTTLEDVVIEEAADALSSWRDTTGSLAVRLDPAFLSDLVAEGYVVEEAATRAEERRRRSARGARTGRRLFGARSFTPPARAPHPEAPATPESPTAQPAAAAAGAAGAAVTAAPEGTTILMRLRVARGTQTQIPFRVAENFFSGIAEVHSAHTGARHGLQIARARGNPNTTKLEIPELRDFSDVFARFEKTPGGVVYEVYDASTPKGEQIKTSLENGFGDGSTQISISDVARATWWRYI